MLKSMYSGVAGMKAHQTKMDVIGNNIANVNTYGFKASRTTFSEVYYQTTSSATGATANTGGKNASQIGYGSQVSGIDILMTRSGFQSTDKATDVAIAGEGFFQIADADGNKYYTRSGNFTFDSAGNLVDTNGNFVLGVSGSPVGIGASSDRIRIDVPSVAQSAGNFEDYINNRKITITSSELTENANVSFSFDTDANMAAGDKCYATISSGVINIYFNPYETFEDLTEINDVVNQAIKAANGEVEHPGGTFRIDVEGLDDLGAEYWPITGEEFISKNYEPVLGSVDIDESLEKVGVWFSTVGNTFTGTGATTCEIERVNDEYVFTVTTENEDGGTNTYVGKITENHLTTGTVKLVRWDTQKDEAMESTDPSDYIILKHPGFDTLTNKTKITDADGKITGYEKLGYEEVEDPNNQGQMIPQIITSPKAAVASEASKALGFGTKQMVLTGGTSGGAQTISDLTNLSIGGDGIITATHAVHGLIEIGRIDLATFDNPTGLIQAGTSYFQESVNSGAAQVTIAGTEGVGALQSNALEMSNVDLSNEFADMITTQRGFQASSRLITVSDEILQELVNLKR